VQTKETIKQTPKGGVQGISSQQVDKPEVEQKPVGKPEVEVAQQILEVFQLIAQEALDRVPKIGTRELVRQIFRQEVEVIEKKVTKIEYEYVEKIVEVPQVVYEERIIGVPTGQTKETIRQDPKARVQGIINEQVDKPEVEQKSVDKPEAEDVQQPLDVSQLIAQDAIDKEPKIVTCELVRQVLRQEVEVIEKQGAKIEHEYVEKTAGVPQAVYEERIIEVLTVQTKEIIKQVPETEAKALSVSALQRNT